MSLIRLSDVRINRNLDTYWRRQWHYYDDINASVTSTTSPGQLPAPVVGAYQQTIDVYEDSIVRVIADAGFYKQDAINEHVACYVELYDDTLAAQLALGRTQVEYDTIRARMACCGFIKEFTLSGGGSKQVSLRVFASPGSKANIRELSWGIDVSKA